MSVYPILLGGTVAANVGLAVVVMLRTRRAFPRAALIAFLLSFAAAHAILLGRASEALGPAWSAPGLAAYVLAHASVGAFAVVFLQGEPIRARIPTLGFVLVPGLALGALGAALGWRPEDTFQPSTDLGMVALNGYLVACLAVALAESLMSWRRSASFRRESFLLVAGTTALIIGGPVYSFELVVLGVTQLLGANPAAPVGGLLFAVAVLRASPLPFRGREPAPDVEIPWSIPAGTYLVEETRPKYAEAMILSARGSASLAIVSEPTEALNRLNGVELARLPAGDRSPSVLGATAAEFLARHRDGTVLVDDLSYVVANAGTRATADALARVVRGKPDSARFILSLSMLTDQEREAISRNLRGTRVVAPDFEAELGEILTAHLGASKDHLQKAALARGKRVEDLAFTDLPALHDHWIASLTHLRSPADQAAQPAWRHVTEALTADLNVLWRTPPTEARPPTRPAAPLVVSIQTPVPAPSPDGFSLIRATEVLSGADHPIIEEGGHPSVPLGTAVREAFLGSLGPAGEVVYRRVMGALRKEQGSIRPEDLSRLAKLAEEVLADLSGAIDVDSARRDLYERKDRLLHRLEGLGRGSP